MVLVQDSSMFIWTSLVRLKFVLETIMELKLSDEIVVKAGNRIW